MKSCRRTFGYGGIFVDWTLIGFVIVGKNISHLTDGDVSLMINFVNQLFHPDHLITVDHKVNHGFFFVGITALGVQISGAAAEGLTQLAAHLLGQSVMMMAHLALSRPSTIKSMVFRAAA